jgi:uncharacterized repeat protein (TIGR04138 family)
LTSRTAIPYAFLVSQLDFADDVMARIREKSGRYDERAYLFVLAALEHLQKNLSARRHVSGEELSNACREFALEQYGLLARPVLEYWGLKGTSDIGTIVFTLIDLNLLKAQDNDRPEDFDGVYLFNNQFEADYPWGAWREECRRD